MSDADAVYMDFEEPPHPWDSAPKPPKKGKKKSEKTPIPLAPRAEVALTGDEVRKGISQRARAAANLKIEGYSYPEIADLCEYETAADARKAVMGVLAALHEPEEYDTLRLIVTQRAEEQFRRSFAMGAADYLKTEGGEMVPNLEKLRWHQTATVDLMNLAIITGTKAPTKVEITPGEADLERIVAEITRRAGHEDIVDAEVLDWEDVPAITTGEDEDWDDDTPQG